MGSANQTKIKSSPDTPKAVGVYQWLKPNLSEDQSAAGQTQVTSRRGGDSKQDSLKAARLRAELQRTAHPCGCKSGAVLTVFALVGWPVWIWLSPSVRTWGDVIVAVLAYPCVIVAAGVIGKIAGIVVGRWRHRRVQRRLTALAR